LPNEPTLLNYATVLFKSNIPRYFLNSIIISGGSTALALVLAVFASYGFARFEFKGKSWLQSFVLIGQLLPTAAIIVPLFITLRWLGLVNTYWGLILVYMIITLPLSVWMLTSYFRAIPVELEEAAIIDGATRLGVLFRVTLPLSLPGLVAVLVYAFVTTWNEFIFALCFATDSTVKTLPIGLAEFSTEFNTDWGGVMAASMVMTVPVALLFLLFQRMFVGGLTAGATKG
jgi:ABC-type glycerol-3-phosphate transport system permease component